MMMVMGGGFQGLVTGEGLWAISLQPRKPHPQNSDRQCPEPMIEVTVGLEVNPFLGLYLLQNIEPLLPNVT